MRFEFRRFTSWLPTYGDELNWWRRDPIPTMELDPRISERGAAQKGRASAPHLRMALHHYAVNLSAAKPRTGRGKGDALKFENVDWFELLREGERMEGLITGH